MVKSNLSISMTYKIEYVHYRSIKSDNGWMIIHGRGLDIFQKPNFDNLNTINVSQEERKCRNFIVTYTRVSQQIN